MKYVICYDICHPRRLQRVGRFWEKHALRRQKSVFIAERSQKELLGLLDEVAGIIAPKQDVIQAWRLAPDQPDEGLSCGLVVPMAPACVVVETGQTHFVRDD